MANLIPFTKRFESSENLVNLLESRGLQICDRNKAIQYLDNIGYYRLSAYMYPLLKMPKTAHLYKEGSTFKKVMMLYRFDKKLRLLMFNEIEKIEIAIRRAVMQITADMMSNPLFPYFFANFLFFFPNLFPNQLCLFPNFLHTPHENYWGFENVNFKDISKSCPCFTENMGNFAAWFNCFSFLKNVNYIFGKAMGCLGRWFIAKYQFSRFETR